MSDWISPAAAVDCQGNPENFVDCTGFQDDGTYFLPGTPTPSYMALGAMAAPAVGLLAIVLLGRKPTRLRVAATAVPAVLGASIPLLVALILRKEDEVGV
jgi:hypothetical protein